MSNNPTLVAIMTLLPLFFRNNPTVEEIEVLLPQIVGAIANAKAGSPFSVAFSESISGHPGTSTFSWSPSAAA
jgi:hypothetical protein